MLMFADTSAFSLKGYRHAQICMNGARSPAFTASKCALKRRCGSSVNDKVMCQELSRENTEEPETHITVETDRAMWAEAFEHADGDAHKVAQRCAKGVADAFSQCYSADENHCVFVIVGPGLNGLIGLYSSVILKDSGYEPFIHAPIPSQHVDVEVFCKERDIGFYDFMPSTLEFYFQTILDSVLGTGFNGGDMRPEFWKSYQVLFSTELPVVSVDVPSGWDLTLGPRTIDVTADSFIKPDVLISLGAPKLCAKRFAGAYHFVAGRHVPREWFLQRGIEVPVYPGEGTDSVLFETNSIVNHKQNGAVYGRPGQFNATLFTNNPRRRWVDVEEDMDLWDELD